MKRVKILATLAVAVAALSIIAGSASATVVTAPAGNAYTGTLNVINAGAVTFHGVADVSCNKVQIEGTIESHGASVTAKSIPSSVVYSECNQHIVSLKRGVLEFHATGNGNATITSSGTEATVEFTTIFGSVHCVFGTNNTHVGTLTGATGDTGHATVDFEGAVIPVVSGSFLCGSYAELTGNAKVTSPTGLRFD